MKYEVVKADDLKTLINLVNLYIEAGWKPQGGIAMIKGTSVQGWFIVYTQALIKED